MKTRYRIVWLISLCSFFWTGCNNDDEIFFENNSLNGTWTLTSYGGGFTGQFEYYKRRDIIWNFDTINNTVLIKSKRDYFGPKSGTYPYEIRQNDQNDQILFLNDSVQGLLNINVDELIFNRVLTATFKR